MEINQGQPKPDKKGKGKAVKTANLLARIDEEIPLINRMEGIDSHNERVFTAPESIKTDKIVQMDIDDEEEMMTFMKMQGNFMPIMMS